MRDDSRAILVVSDDRELGGLVALNLRRRGWQVHQATVTLARDPSWVPDPATLRLLIVVVEAPERFPAFHLAQLVLRPWAQGVPLVLAAERAAALVHALPKPPDELVSCPTDLGAIVAAARASVSRGVSP
jgi:DNA-binding response OmpR family regulator